MKNGKALMSFVTISGGRLTSSMTRMTWLSCMSLTKRASVSVKHIVRNFFR